MPDRAGSYTKAPKKGVKGRTTSAGSKVAKGKGTRGRKMGRRKGR